MEKVLLGMSGGIDSTYACRVLQEKGYKVEGLFLKLHGEANSIDAEAAAEKLGIKLHIADYTDLFKKEVEDFFVGEYLQGRTPNPCVVCNRRIKLLTLLREADKLGIHYVATGHYVNVVKKGDHFTLKTATDTKKDQSYFLWQLTQEQLSRFLTPLWDYEKKAVIDEVKKRDLTKTTEESQEICFIPNDDYVDYLKKRLSKDDYEKAFGEGDFILKDRGAVGKHKGIASYTVGQRKGLGIALGRPAFVIKINPDKREVVLGFEEDNISSTIEVGDLNFMGIDELEGELECYVRPRYRSPLVPCTVVLREGQAMATTHSPIKMPSPGQSAVFYDGEGQILFGGYIK